MKNFYFANLTLCFFKAQSENFANSQTLKFCFYVILKSGRKFAEGISADRNNLVD